MHSTTSAWYVFYTMPKHEKRVFNLLREKSYDVYLPTQVVERQWSDRKKKVVLPLFPNYLFVKTVPHQLYYVLSTGGVVKVLSQDQQPVTIPQDEIDRIRLMTSKGFNVEIGGEEEFIPGTLVRITDGLFAGVCGRLLKSKGKCRLLVELKALNKLMKVDVPAEHLEKIDELSEVES